jgi:hypothetical protein
MEELIYLVPQAFIMILEWYLIVVVCVIVCNCFRYCLWDCLWDSLIIYVCYFRFLIWKLYFGSFSILFVSLLSETVVLLVSYLSPFSAIFISFSIFISYAIFLSLMLYFVLLCYILFSYAIYCIFSVLLVYYSIFWYYFPILIFYVVFNPFYF